MAISATEGQVPVPLNKISYRAQWAAQSIREDLAKVQREATVVPTDTADVTHLLPVANTRAASTTSEPRQGFKAGIIGAGVAGMFTAMLFDHLNKKFPDLNVDYTIFEAEEERIGGRLYTYTFPQKDGQPMIGPHDYYDVGAMRFPEVKIMERTFALFKTLGMTPVNPETLRPQPGDLIPYHYKGVNQPALYNGVQVVQKDGKPALSGNTFRIPKLLVNVRNTESGELIDARILWLKNMYNAEDPQVFWRTLKEEVDPYSVRQYFTTQVNPPLDYKTLEFCEALNFGNRWYDQAASEMVLESLDFEADADW
ncbi:hypothetical protein NX059_000079 [Plenodomus lindquistii]|nr:hypothetical protein NX059_000079 [Plenodomus lindquistii]